MVRGEIHWQDKKNYKRNSIKLKAKFRSYRQGQFRSKLKEWQHIIIEKTNKANLYDQLL
jgi:hypothetical protein